MPGRATVSIPGSSTEKGRRDEALFLFIGPRSLGAQHGVASTSYAQSSVNQTTREPHEIDDSVGAVSPFLGAVDGQR
jgi:hypothetical protein